MKGMQHLSAFVAISRTDPRPLVNAPTNALLQMQGFGAVREQVEEDWGGQ